MNRYIRWIPIAYYAFAVIWAMLAGTIELDQVIQYTGILGAGFFLALAGEFGLDLRGGVQ